jgi:acetyl esterase
MSTFILKFFFKIPIFVLKIFFKKKSSFRGHQFDIQSQALISLQPTIDLTSIPDNEISKIRNIIIKNRVHHNLSSNPKSFVKKVNHFLGNDSTLCREYIPSKISSNKAILFFHGGGYVLNSVETHDGYVSYMADMLQAKMYSLEYKLAPEYEYPIALNDAIEAYYWLIKKGYEPENISVCGDSAGAHLAASLVHKLIEVDKEQIPHSQFLIYPMCDPDCSSESYDFLSEGYLLTKKTMIWFWNKFGNSENNKNDPAFNLLKLITDEKLPHTIIITAGFDPLCDDGEKYAYLLHKRGDNVKQLHYPNMFHGFVSSTRLNAAKIAVDDFLGEYKKII